MRPLAALSVLLFSGCAAPDPAFLRASRAYYDLTAPVVIKAVGEDETLSQDQKGDRINAVSDYERLLQAEEEASR